MPSLAPLEKVSLEKVSLEPIDTAVYQPVSLIHRNFGSTSPTGKVFPAGFGVEQENDEPKLKALEASRHRICKSDQFAEYRNLNDRNESQRHQRYSALPMVHQVLKADYADSNPFIVPVLVANLSNSRPVC